MPSILTAWVAMLPATGLAQVAGGDPVLARELTRWCSSEAPADYAACQGFIMGVVTAVEYLENSGQGSLDGFLSFCRPGDVPATIVVEAYAAFVAANPHSAALRGYAEVGVLAAMHEAFPCT